ncbi:hypothetical protein [Streptomyces mirabilis]|uniref:hypothetical protein n=1 Tax=Streptomyces mirabilis TaxID=68239 RepID=UPI00368EBAAF
MNAATNQQAPKPNSREWLEQLPRDERWAHTEVLAQYGDMVVNPSYEVALYHLRYAVAEVKRLTGRIVELEAVYADARTQALAEAKDAVVEWLVKKAHEGTEVSRLADKVERGAIRLFHDAELAAAAAEPQHYDKVPDPADGCHWCACGNRWPCKHAPVVTS